ncbi:hypothetical protein BIFADO_00374 [Bifidobacterium adolescentis L2-32]|uniref:Uncharacterized protein n=1 Tax=Bifidobacterium adolescentis L2-32 TaxID=411481 RepID=A7A3I3_BIFAD|nr:hypothetical protein BIFADO_00374 [Bifidobacterium adolescentis L2-32]
MLVTGFLSWESIPLYGAQRTRQTSPMQRAPARAEKQRRSPF